MIAGRLLGDCWVIAGRLLGDCWVIAGRLLGDCWVVAGRSLGDHRPISRMFYISPPTDRPATAFCQSSSGYGPLETYLHDFGQRFYICVS